MLQRWRWDCVEPVYYSVSLWEFVVQQLFRKLLDSRHKCSACVIHDEQSAGL